MTTKNQKCDICGNFAGFETSPEGDMCAICGEVWLCKECGKAAYKKNPKRFDAEIVCPDCYKSIQPETTSPDDSSINCELCPDVGNACPNCPERENENSEYMTLEVDGNTIQIKVETEGIVLDVFSPDGEEIGTTYKFWNELGIDTISFFEKTIVKKYIENGGVNCPYCESENLTGDNKFNRFDAVSLWQVITCNECGKTWKDIYTLTRLEEE